MKTIVGWVAFVVAIPTLAAAGPFKLPGKIPEKPKVPEAAECPDDRGVESIGKEMDEKAFDALVAAGKSLTGLYEAAGRKEEAEKQRETVKGWTMESAPAGLDRVKEIQRTSDTLTRGSEAIASKGVDAAGKESLTKARWDLRTAVLHVAWGVKIGEPVPGKAKEAIAASAACAKKVKPAADAAAALGTLLGNLKKSYGAVDAAAKKAGAPEMTEEEKKRQEGETGAPSGLGV